MHGDFICTLICVVYCWMILSAIFPLFKKEHKHKQKQVQFEDLSDGQQIAFMVMHSEEWKNVVRSIHTATIIQFPQKNTGKDE